MRTLLYLWMKWIGSIFPEIWIKKECNTLDKCRQCIVSAQEVRVYRGSLVMQSHEEGYNMCHYELEQLYTQKDSHVCNAVWRGQWKEGHSLGRAALRMEEMCCCHISVRVMQVYPMSATGRKTFKHITIFRRLHNVTISFFCWLQEVCILISVIEPLMTQLHLAVSQLHFA